MTTHIDVVKHLQKHGRDKTFTAVFGKVDEIEFNSRLSIALELFIDSRMDWAKEEIIKRLNSK